MPSLTSRGCGEAGSLPHQHRDQGLVGRTRVDGLGWSPRAVEDSSVGMDMLVRGCLFFDRTFGEAVVASMALVSLQLCRRLRPGLARLWRTPKCLCTNVFVSFQAV